MKWIHSKFFWRVALPLGFFAVAALFYSLASLHTILTDKDRDDDISAEDPSSVWFLTHKQKK